MTTFKNAIEEYLAHRWTVKTVCVKTDDNIMFIDRHDGNYNISVHRHGVTTKKSSAECPNEYITFKHYFGILIPDDAPSVTTCC